MLLVRNVTKKQSMELKAKLSKEKFVINYINIFNGGLGLTFKEKEFLSEILNKYLDLIEDGLSEPYLGKIVFSKDTMGEIRKKLNISSQGLNNYKAQLKEKKVFRETKDGLQVDPKLIPQKTLTFKFEVV